MAAVVRGVHCELRTTRRLIIRVTKQTGPAIQVSIPKPKLPDSESANIILQPRVCNLRTYGSDRGVIKKRTVYVHGDDGVSPFFATLSEYIESSKKSHDFEIISGRLAMIIFAATVTEEWVTGNSLFRKMDVQGIAEAGSACLAAVLCAALFAWFSSARNRVGRIFTLSCNSIFDSLIDQLIDGLFYEIELRDWSDDLNVWNNAMLGPTLNQNVYGTTTRS